MGFDARDIHPPLDVFSRDGVFLGSILAVVPKPAAANESTHSPRPDADTVVPPSTFSGELLGPMPTGPLGNPGPVAQSARAGYAAEVDGARPLGDGAMVVGRWWGLLGRRTIPLRQVLSISLERVTLTLTAEELRAQRSRT
jgi:hypothetical protein